MSTLMCPPVFSSQPAPKKVDIDEDILACFQRPNRTPTGVRLRNTEAEMQKHHEQRETDGDADDPGKNPIVDYSTTL